MSVSQEIRELIRRRDKLRASGFTYAHAMEQGLLESLVERLQRADNVRVESNYLHPGYGKFYPIQTVLRDLASQENCDGEPYDAMIHAADYVDLLERRVQELEQKNDELSTLAAEEHGRAHRYEHAGLAIRFYVENKNSTDLHEFLRVWSEGAWDELDETWPEWREYLDAHR